MEFGSINILVNDPDVALKTYLRLLGTNNIEQIIRLRGLKDDADTIDGYYLKTQPVHLGLFRPRNSGGRMGAALEKYGEGIHHIELHLAQDEFEETYTKFKRDGRPVSEKAIYIGKFSEAVFWLEDRGEHGVPIKFATKAHRGLTIWEDTLYLDTPQKFEKIDITEDYFRPGIRVGTVMVTVNASDCDFDELQSVWASILSLPADYIGNIFTKEKKEVDDRRGNIFLPVRYQFPGGGGINLYCALNAEGPINRVMARRQKRAMYHNAAGFMVRDKVHECWRQWEEAGFAMVDPKPLLNAGNGNGNYFFFVHPTSTHGVLWEWVSSQTRNEDRKAVYDWNDTEIYTVSPAIRRLHEVRENHTK